MDVHPTKNVSIGIDPYPYKLSKYSLLVRILAGLCVEVAEHVFHDVANVGYAFQG